MNKRPVRAGIWSEVWKNRGINIIKIYDNNKATIGEEIWIFLCY